jgi:hypothetical protein
VTVLGGGRSVTLTFTARQVEALCLAVSHFLHVLEGDEEKDAHGHGFRQVLDPVEDRLLFAWAGASQDNVVRAAPSPCTPEGIAELAYWHMELGSEPDAWRRFWRHLYELTEPERQAMVAAGVIDEYVAAGDGVGAP